MIIRRKLVNKAGTKPGLITFYQQDLFDAYKRAKFKKFPIESINPVRHQDFLEGLFPVERALLSQLGTSETVNREIRTRQRARLLARKLGIPIDDVSL